MYADRVDLEKRSIKERLNLISVGDSTQRRTLTGKRQRHDEKWEHDLYKDDQTMVPKNKLDSRDLRLKLRRKNVTLKGGVQDLRGHPPKQKLEPEADKVARKSITTETPAAELKKATNSTVMKNTWKKVGGSVDRFLQSLGLEKYLITFQAEEIDMTALQHLTDGDLKAMGIPMGPRKKILLSLAART